MTFNPPNTFSPFLPINEAFVDDPEQFLVQMTKLYSDIARYQNVREISLYDLTELMNGQQWFTVGNPQIKRFAFRQVYQIPATATGATTNIAHGITGETIFTKIYGTLITDFPDYRPLPYVTATGNVTLQTSVRVDTTNIIIVNGAGAPNITDGIVVLEYLKN